MPRQSVCQPKTPLKANTHASHTYTCTLNCVSAIMPSLIILHSSVGNFFVSYSYLPYECLNELSDASTEATEKHFINFFHLNFSFVHSIRSFILWTNKTLSVYFLLNFLCFPFSFLFITSRHLSLSSCFICDMIQLLSH